MNSPMLRTLVAVTAAVVIVGLVGFLIAAVSQR